MRFLLFASLIVTSSAGLSSQNNPNVLNEMSNKQQNRKYDQQMSKLNKEWDICGTSVCETAGKALKANLNESVDPCHDFYGFACGGWEDSHTIPDQKSHYFGDTALQETIERIINESLAKTHTESVSKSVIYAKDLYKSCIDNVTREAQGVGPLLRALRSITDWPLISHHFNSSAFDWQQSLTSMITIMGSHALYAIDVVPDANDTHVYKLTFDSPAFLLGRNQLINISANPDIVNAYKQYILQSALLLGANNDSQTHRDIDDLLHFESQLASETLTPEAKRNPNIWYNRITFEEFNKLTDNTIDWLNITNNIYSQLGSAIRVKSDELVIVEDIDYYKSVTKLLDKTPKRVIANYFGWYVISGLSSWTTGAFRDTNFAFNRIISGAVKDEELWKYCYNDLSDAFEYVLSRLYVEKSFTPKDKRETLVIINEIKDSFHELIEESDWLDSNTKNNSLIKLNAIQINAGYPDWVFNDQQLDNYYKLTQKVDSKHFFESILYLQYNSGLREFNSLRESVNRSLNWPMAAHIVNAAYEATQNSITIPAGQLTAPYFKAGIPAHINYGAIGSVIGHELTHGFDDEGSQFDANGNLINWWTQTIHKRFDERADCFINQYNSYIDSQTEMRLNGNNTVGENIADNGGLREAFRAYVSSRTKRQRLPHISQYTTEQQFFISYANTWCTKYRTEYMKNMIEYNSHSPAKYRVNIPVSNFQIFSEVFKCSVSSPMNPKDKCILW